MHNRRGVGNIGKRHIQWSPELIASVIISITKFSTWKKRLEYVKECNPEIAHLLKEKNLKERAKKKGWVKQAKLMIEKSIEKAIGESQQANEEITINALKEQMELAEDLTNQIARMREALKDPELEVGSARYTSIMKSIKDATAMMKDLANTDRVKDIQSMKDKAEMTLAVYEQKQKIKLESKEDNALKISKNSVTIISDDTE